MDDVIDRRYFGVLRCVDKATGFPLNRQMRLASDDMEFVRNRSSLYVIKQATGLADYGDSFESAPDLPANESLSFSVEVLDPLAEYLPRLIQVDLPRDADPDNASDASSLFKPVNVELYAAPNARIMANWSTVRVSIHRDDPDLGLVPVAGGLLRVVRESDDEILSSGMSDQRGEALVIVPGVPVTQFADEEADITENPGRGGNPHTEVSPVVISEIPARLELSLSSTQPWPTNPDLLELNHTTNLVATENLTLRTGRMEKVAIQIS